MTDMPDGAAALAALTAPARKVDRRLLGEVRDGLQQLPDDGPLPVWLGGDGHPDLAIRRRSS